jgi:UDP-N-acetylmuramate--alanine ligase
VFACVDDPGSARLIATAGAVGYGTGEDATWRITDLAADPQGSRFHLQSPSGRWDVVLPRPGVHMARNAAGALALLDSRGIEVTQALEGLARFAGVGRRWDERGTVRGITVIDDYAHHPTEVAATLEAALSGNRRVVAVFQPHLYSRTAAHADAFGVALARAAVTVVLPVYGAREEPIEGVDARLISDAARRAGAHEVVDAPDRASAVEVVNGIVTEGDLVVCMGAGDITDLPDELLRLLGADS